MARIVAKYDVKFGSMSMDFRVDVFNLFDNDGITEVRELAESGDVGNPDVNFGRPTHYQAPRTVRFGVGIHF